MAMTDIGLSSPVLLVTVASILFGFGRPALAGAVCLYLCEPASVVSLMKAWNMASQVASCGWLCRYALWRAAADLRPASD
jgi:hypothetical protein